MAAPKSDLGIHHNINFPRRDGPSNQILRRKSVILDVV